MSKPVEIENQEPNVVSEIDDDEMPALEEIQDEMPALEEIQDEMPVLENPQDN